MWASTRPCNRCSRCGRWRTAPSLAAASREAFSHPEQTIREDFGTTRFDDNLAANDLLFGVYTVDDSTANTPRRTR